VFARIIGLEAAVKLGKEFGGSNIYFPQLDALTVSRRAARDKKIVEDHERGEYTKEQLGRKYKMTATGIASVLKRAKAWKKEEKPAPIIGSIDAVSAPS
jgi:Mor family transcriptional regulator